MLYIKAEMIAIERLIQKLEVLQGIKGNGEGTLTLGLNK